MDWFDECVAKAKRNSGCYEEMKIRETYRCSRCGNFFSTKVLGRFTKKTYLKGKIFCSQKCLSAASYEPKN
jgi:hypothetical protein